MSEQFRTVLVLLSLFAGGMAAGPCFGAAIGFTPSQQNATDGDVVSVDIIATGLGNGASPSIGSFDLDVLFDAAVLSFQSYSIGSALGVSPVDASLGDLGGGLIDLAALSLEDPADLNASQSSTVSLASLSFQVVSLAVGASTTISIDSADSLLLLGDENYDSLTITGLSSAKIVNPSTVPLPQTWLLVGLGLGLLRFSPRHSRACGNRRRHGAGPGRCS